MNIQTISIVVPTHGCVNECKACVSRMHKNSYITDFNKDIIKRRLKWAVMNGVNTCILTGTGEALQNIQFLKGLSEVFTEMDTPFPNVELQTTGVMLTRENLLFLHELGVSTISLSVWDIFDDAENMRIINCRPTLSFKLHEVVTTLKVYGFNVRLSLNMTTAYDNVDPKYLLTICKQLGADQVTFRKLYHNEDYTLPQTVWVKQNACKEVTLDKINQYIQGVKYKDIVEAAGVGKHLYDLPFGGKVYSVNEMSVVMDDDCMSKNNTNVLKYVILRENGKLYGQWDDKGSLIF